ncbi:tRNA threonylcarbamoyladenosine dehydratase [Atopobium fossor]|uniref:tRNA threonylcarbamoyladenosine dehydratase n=1 Tax=Atopobium fossor TaxID=39487 RepID=UPI0003F94B22|nr:tRNA threonylcarbamoyladenosine dehydratase [Atopobium fossor]
MDNTAITATDIINNPAMARLMLVMGEDALVKLANSCVMIIGIGGVGSNCAEALARGGVGKFILLDRDTVELSNINRQAVAFHSTVGRPKVEVMAQLIYDINPAAQVQIVHAFLPKAVEEVLNTLPRPDYLVDAIDTISQKLALAKWCQDQGIPEISSMGGANKIDPTYFQFAPIEKTTICPVARIMRKECKKRGINKLQVLYSDEVPLPALGDGDGQMDKGSILGTMSYIPPLMGHMLAGRVIRDITGLVNNQTKHR